MEYNFEKIGKRIKEERKAAGLKSQNALIEKLNDEYGYSIHRNLLSAIENGKTSHYDSELLFDLCEIFGCRLGYLLCEYDDKKITELSDATGLSTSAIDNILRLDPDYRGLLSKLASYSNFINIIDHCSGFIQNYKEVHGDPVLKVFYDNNHDYEVNYIIHLVADLTECAIKDMSAAGDPRCGG